jgi:hypothetical protein
MILIVLWVVVICLEKMKGGRAREREAGKERKKEEEPDGIITAIIAGIMAYEESLVVTSRKRDRVVYERKEERTSWWKMKERMKQTKRRG